jgi:two-component system cell cycle response regulator DivK
MSHRILLIEDNEQNRYLATFLLESHGYQVDCAFDGAAGLEAARAKQPDLILLDIQLPQMDGHEVARRLRAIPDLAATPIIAVTSYAMVGDRERSIASGCDGYIEKPIDTTTFVATIEEIVATARASRAGS